MAKIKTESVIPSRGLDLEKAKKKFKDVEEKSAGTYYEMKEGWNFLYVLPPWSEDNVIWKEVEQHGLLVCPKRVTGKECLICQEIPKRAKRGDTDFANEYHLKSRAFFNAVPKDKIKKLATAPESVIKVLAVSGMIFREILEYINDEDVDISDPKKCILVGIKKTGKGFRTKYKLKMGDAVDISKYFNQKTYDALFDLDIIKGAQPASVKDMRKAIKGAADDDDDDDDEDLTDEDFGINDDVEDDTDDALADDLDELDADSDDEEEDEEDSEEEVDGEEDVEDEIEDDDEEEEIKPPKLSKTSSKKVSKKSSKK